MSTMGHRQKWGTSDRVGISLEQYPSKTGRIPLVIPLTRSTSLQIEGPFLKLALGDRGQVVRVDLGERDQEPERSPYRFAPGAVVSFKEPGGRGQIRPGVLRDQGEKRGVFVPEQPEQLGGDFVALVRCNADHSNTNRHTRRRGRVYQIRVIDGLSMSGSEGLNHSLTVDRFEIFREHRNAHFVEFRRFAYILRQVHGVF